MKKILSSILILVLVMTSLVGCGNSEAQNTETSEEVTYNWRFAHEENNGSIQDVYVKKFAKKLKEKSNGRINIDIYPVGQIGDATQQCELLQNGGLEFAMISPGNTGTIVPENQLFSLHFLLSEDPKMNMKLFKESKALNDLLAKKYLEKNIKILAYWSEGTMEWTSSKPVSSPEDWKGFKMRTMPSPMIVASYEAYGANPTPMPYMEVYSGLQLKMIQGQENPLSAIEEMKFHEVQDYLTLASASHFVTTTAVNPDFFNGLPEDVQQMIIETVDELREEAYKIETDLNGGALEKIKESSDITVVKLTDEERAAFKDASKAAYDRYIETVGEDGKEILELLQKEVSELK